MVKKIITLLFVFLIIFIGYFVINGIYLSLKYGTFKTYHFPDYTCGSLSNCLKINNDNLLLLGERPCFYIISKNKYGQYFEPYTNTYIVKFILNKNFYYVGNKTLVDYRIKKHYVFKNVLDGDLIVKKISDNKLIYIPIKNDNKIFQVCDAGTMNCITKSGTNYKNYSKVDFYDINPDLILIVNKKTKESEIFNVKDETFRQVFLNDELYLTKKLYFYKNNHFLTLEKNKDGRFFTQINKISFYEFDSLKAKKIKDVFFRTIKRDIDYNTDILILNDTLALIHGRMYQTSYNPIETISAMRNYLIDTKKLKIIPFKNFNIGSCYSPIIKIDDNKWIISDLAKDPTDMIERYKYAIFTLNKK